VRGEETLPGVLLRLVDSIGIDEPNRRASGAGSNSRSGLARHREQIEALRQGKLEELAARLA
jgi:hypothetical protein